MNTIVQKHREWPRWERRRTNSFTIAFAFLTLAMAATVGRAGSATFGFATEQDNARLDSMVVGGTPVLLAPAGSGTPGHLYVISYQNSTWSRAVLPMPTGVNCSTVQGVNNTDRVVYWTTNSPVVVTFASLQQLGTNSWQLAPLAAVNAPTGTTSLSLLPSRDSSAAVANCYPQNRVFLLQGGQPAIDIGSWVFDVVWTPSGILVSRGSSNVKTAALYHASTGAPLQSATFTSVWSSVQANGVWFTNNNSVVRLGLPALAQDRSLPIGTDTPNNLLLMSDGGILLQASATNGAGFVIRFAADGTMKYRWPTAVSALTAVSPDGRFAANADEIIDAATGATITRNFLNPQPCSGQALVGTPDGKVFIALAHYWEDNVVGQEIDTESGIWQSPSLFPSPQITPAVLTFGSVTNGSETVLPIFLTSSYSMWVNSLVHGSSTGDSPFAALPNYVSFPVGGSNIQSSIYYRPQDSGPHLSYFKTEKSYATGGGEYNVAMLFGRTTPSPSLTAGQMSNLVRYACSQVKFFLDAESNNLKVGWPCSWYSPESGRTKGSYCVPHEIGLRLLTLAAAARQGWTDTNTAWAQVELGLNSLRLMQQRQDQFPNGTFYCYYRIRNSDGTDRSVAEITHDDDAPSSDDNCLLAMSLMLVDRLARDAQQASASSLCRQVLAQLNLRWFLTAAGNGIAQNRSPSGSYSSTVWDRRGDEGPAIAAAMACLRQLSRDEFSSVLAGMTAPWGHWRGRIFVPQGDTMGAMFVRGVRSQAGCPITPDEFADCNYAAGTAALLAAHLDDCSERGTGMIFSHGMTITVNKISQATGKGAGNESGAVLPEERQARTGTHAVFVPLARAGWLPQDMILQLFNQMANYEPLYFHDEPGRRGWETVVPFDPHGPYLGTDQGHVHEALNSAYIVLSVFDALASQPLSALHPAQTLLGPAMAFVDSATPLPPDFPTNYYPNLDVPVGSLQVTLSPAAVVSAGAQWRVDGGVWQNSGATVSNLSVGNHTVQFNSVTGWNPLPDQTVFISVGPVTTTTGIYTQPTIVQPLNNSTLTNGPTTFIWSSGVGVSQYALWVGSSANSYDLYALNEGANLSQTLMLPADGRQLYVTLWSLINGTTWQTNSYTYTTFKGVKSRMGGPANGATLTNASTTFTWDAGVGASQYALWVGSRANSYDLYALAEGTNRSHTLMLPLDGRSLYVTLWSFINGAWQNTSYVFTAYTAPAPARAQMQSPAPGGTLTNTTVSFSWDSGTGVDGYALWVGRTPSSYDLVAQATGTNQTYTVTTMPSDGGPLYVTLWSSINGVWENHSYNYTAWLEVEGVKARMISPANGATLSGCEATFAWNAGTGASQYALWVGSAAGIYDISALSVGTNLSWAVNVPATGGALYVRLWSWVSGVWQYNAYNYTTVAPAKAQMISPTNGVTFSSTSVGFSWDSGVGGTQYALWVGRAPSSYDVLAMATGTNRTWNVTEMPSDGSPVYVTLWTWLNGTWLNNSYRYKAWTAGGLVKASMTTPANGAVLPTCSTVFGWDTGVGVTQYALWVGRAGGAYDIYAALETNQTRTVTVPATGGAIYVRLWSWIGSGWQWSDYSYTAPEAVKAQMQSPANGATLTNATTTFSWDSGTGVAQYALWAGSAPSSYDLEAVATGTNQTYTVTGLPVDGGPIYVTLWSLIDRGMAEHRVYLPGVAGTLRHGHLRMGRGMAGGRKRRPTKKTWIKILELPFGPRTTLPTPSKET